MPPDGLEYGRPGPPGQPVPSQFTAFDLFFELLHITLVAVGCYVGWKLGGHFLALLAGGAVARGVGLAVAISVRPWLDDERGG